MKAKFGGLRSTVGTRGLTLIELLVVVAIVAILAALILPGLAGAKNRSRRIHCLNNNKQAGIAFQMYTSDYDNTYPLHEGWASYAGSQGVVANHHGGTVPVEKRPLNRYVGDALEAFHCPSDKGDTEVPHLATAWEAYGNSYRVQWAIDSWRTMRLTGDSRSRHPYHGASMTATEVAVSPENKIIQGDWHWHGNRDSNADQSVWHNYRGTPVFNMLWGDGHADFFRFPLEYKKWGDDPLPSPDFTWW